MDASAPRDRLAPRRRTTPKRAAGKRGAGIPGISNIHRTAHVAGHAQYAAEELCVNFGRTGAPKRKSSRDKVARGFPREAASAEGGCSFASLPSAEILDARATEQDDEDEESLQRIESSGPKIRSCANAGAAPIIRRVRRRYNINLRQQPVRRPISFYWARRHRELNPVGHTSTGEDNSGDPSAGGCLVGYHRSDLQTDTILTTRRRTRLIDQ